MHLPICQQVSRSLVTQPAPPYTSNRYVHSSNPPSPIVTIQFINNKNTQVTVTKFCTCFESQTCFRGKFLPQQI